MLLLEYKPIKPLPLLITYNPIENFLSYEYEGKLYPAPINTHKISKEDFFQPY